MKTRPQGDSDETRDDHRDAAEDISALLAELDAALEHRIDLIRWLGSGGMGRIDLVRDRALERNVVTKRLHQQLEAEGRTLRAFVREAQITAQLEHPGIVPVHDIGRDDRGSIYFTMKRIEGRTLSRVIESLPAGPLNHDALLDLVEIVIKVCDALAFAHARGFIHLDIKPANVMVGDFGQVYLMDWGLARRPAGSELPPITGLVEVAEGSAEPRLSLEGAPTGSGPVLVGTATHMSPEQARGQSDALDERTDVFGVGALLYHMLARAAPYEADSYWIALVRAQTGGHRPLATVAPWVPGLLIRITEKAMSLEPSARHASMLELKQELVAFTRGGGVFETVSFKAGEHVIREGEPGDCAYIIESGVLEVVRNEGGGPKRLRTMGPGEVFGEMAILAPGPRTATVIVLEDAALRRVTAETLAREVESLKPWMGKIVRTLAERFRDREERVSKLP